MSKESYEHGGRGSDGQTKGLPTTGQVDVHREHVLHSTQVRSYSKLSDAPQRTYKAEEGLNVDISQGWLAIRHSSALSQRPTSSTSIHRAIAGDKQISCLPSIIITGNLFNHFFLLSVDVTPLFSVMRSCLHPFPGSSQNVPDVQPSLLCFATALI